uniref:Uncharacterized protein n=1 Tax=Lactuca sativa TaxID=4236 RepID=A0A9R1WYY6_LACSA|nr:hypothetical protein LSAT_V11C800449760 [Lactuca sativa]
MSSWCINQSKWKELFSHVLDLFQSIKKVIGLDGCFLKEQVEGELLTSSGRDANNQGLFESVKDILPHVDHRQYARQIYVNFKKDYIGLEFKKLFWATTMNCVEGDFKRHIDAIRKLNPSAYDNLMSKEPQTWCIAYMSVRYVCEVVENGILE